MRRTPRSRNAISIGDERQKVRQDIHSILHHVRALDCVFLFFFFFFFADEEVRKIYIRETTQEIHADE